MLDDKQTFEEKANSKEHIEEYNRVIETIKSMIKEIEEAGTGKVLESSSDYFKYVGEFYLNLVRLESELDESYFETRDIATLKTLNKALYEDILPTNYQQSWGNPTYTTKLFGQEKGKILAFVYAEIRACIADAYEHRQYDLMVSGKLLIDLYTHMIQDANVSVLKEVIADYAKAYTPYQMELHVRAMVDSSLSFATDIVLTSDLQDLRYLYKYGEYISHNEIQIAEYLNSLPEERIHLMAKMYADAYRRGFVRDGMDLSIKKTVNIRYAIGFERVIAKSIHFFREMGLEPIIFRYASKSVLKKQHLRVGYTGTSPNKQFDYDHRFDQELYLDEAYVALKVEATEKAYIKYREEAKVWAGPALIEVFGKAPFSPENKEEACQLDKEKQELNQQLITQTHQITYTYIPSDEWSFTINAYPIPEIGEAFEAIFNDIIRVNTLDSDKYEKIQQIIIDTLDQADFVHIKGRGNNKTDIKVYLHALKDSKKETKFENCVADVNVPVGEVFTSPVLEKTDGCLHVEEAYLNELKYTNLVLTFKDGFIVDYTCSNFEEEEENRRYVKENLLYNYETLPLGEFAIGTNTTAYVMANKYGIEHILPILIVEKMGPHFAVGDTCYARKEDHATFNPDGKEMIARDNEKTLLRKNGSENVYYNCHTDITIPYNAIGAITAVTEEGAKIDIIKDGRFLLSGTEYLNEAFND